MDLTQITQITQKLVQDGVLDEASLKYLEADAKIVAIGCPHVLAKIIGDTFPGDRTLLKRTLLIEHGKPNITTYVRYIRIGSPHPFLDGIQITAYPSHTKPSVRRLTHAAGFVLGKSNYIEPIVNKIKMQTRPVWLLDAATKYEPVLKQKAHLQVRSVDGSDRSFRSFASDLKTAVASQKLADVKALVIHTLQYQLKDLPLAIAKQGIESFHLLESPKSIGRIETDIFAKSVKIRKQLADGIKKVEKETLDRLSAEVLSKPFLRKKKRQSRERAILKDYTTSLMMLISDSLTALNLIGKGVKLAVIEKIMKAYADLLSDLQDIDPNFVDSSPELTPPSVPPRNSGFTIPACYSISRFALEWMVWLATTGPIIGTGIGVIRHHCKSVKTAKKSFCKQAAEARESLVEDFDSALRNLIAKNQVTVTTDLSASTSDLDARLNEFRDKIAKKFKREEQDVTSLSVTELTDRLRRYTAYLDQLGQDC